MPIGVPIGASYDQYYRRDIYCKGCSTKSRCTLSIEQRKDCPCKICLVKSMCDIYCEDYKHNRYLFG